MRSRRRLATLNQDKRRRFDSYLGSQFPLRHPDSHWWLSGGITFCHLCPAIGDSLRNSGPRVLRLEGD